MPFRLLTIAVGRNVLQARRAAALLAARRALGGARRPVAAARSVAAATPARLRFPRMMAGMWAAQRVKQAGTGVLSGRRSDDRQSASPATSRGAIDL